MLQKFYAHKKIYGGVGIFILVIASYIYFWILSENEKTAFASIVPVKTFTVGESSGELMQGFAGEIHSVYESNLSFQMAGKILSRKVKVGDHIHRGDVLVVLDTQDQEESVQSMRAQEAAAASQLKLARKNMQRYQKLLSEGAVSAADYDQYLQQYEAAQAAVEQSAAQSAQSRNQLGYGFLRADRDGVITKIKAEAGQTVSAGESIVTIADEGALEVEFFVPENIIGELKISQNISVALWNQSKVSYKAIIREISPVADEETRTFLVKAQLQGDLSQVKLGMTAKVFSAESQAMAVCIPVAAVFEQSGQGKGVWLIRNGKISFAKVELGRLNKELVEVVQGLHKGDRIVAAGVQKLQDGQCVGGQDN